MSDRPTFWFPAKRYGWGWGLPVRWQGWAVLGAYLALVCAGIYYFKGQRDVSGLIIVLVCLTVALIVVAALKGERPLGWRWGKR